MTFYRAQVNLPYDTAIPRDASVNTFHFFSDDVDSQANEIAEMQTSLETLYAAFDQLLSPNLAADATIKYYDLSDAEPRIPLYQESFTISPGTAPMPNEVCIAVSYQGATVSGSPQRRRRGRIYLGPLGGASTVVDATGDVEISSTDRTTIATAFGALVPNLGGASLSTIVWSVFSRATFAETGSLNLSFIPVNNGWVDNKFDIQRRRGTLPTSRTIFS